MKLSAVVKPALASHAWLGIVAGGLMYLICLSGTLAVFYEELERWEQPTVHETLVQDPAVVQRAVAAALMRLPASPDHFYVTLPTTAVPRLSVSSDQPGQAWFVEPDGSLGDAVAHDWTHLLLNLHIYLHLPSTIGLLVVGTLGALLVGLIASGVLAHPRIFKDAFRLRAQGTTVLDQADVHNRLSVWGLPFHIVIALTGAYFGLASILFVLLGAAFHGGNTNAASAAIFAAEPAARGPAMIPDVAAALRGLRRVVPPGTSPSLVTLHDAGTAMQYLELQVLQPGRLIWAEYHRFDARGTYLGRTDYSDGPVGRQVAYSTYRVHFGQFGGWPVKILYGVLGLSLTVVSATGFNIWLARRRTRDYLNDLWAGVIWSPPAALALTAITEVLLDVSSVGIFWVALAAGLVWSVRLRDPVRARQHLCVATSTLLALLVAGYLVTFGVTRLNPAAWWITVGLCAIAVALAGVARAARVSPSDVEREPIDQAVA